MWSSLIWVYALQDKQQAAWYDGTTVMDEDHKAGHWNWRKPSRAVGTIHTQQKHFLQDGSEQRNLDRIDNML